MKKKIKFIRSAFVIAFSILVFSKSNNSGEYNIASFFTLSSVIADGEGGSGGLILWRRKFVDV